jgi:hypothetical protein
MFTPSLVLAYCMRGSMAQPFYDMAGLRNVNSERVSTNDLCCYEVLDRLHYHAGHRPPNPRDLLDTLCDGAAQTV